MLFVPSYYDDFRCLAGSCPHSCCQAWEVVLDEKSVARYETVPGALGEKLRRAMTRDAEGDVCFTLQGGRCPFLDGENLCEIHRQLGQEATSETCRSHPRFIEEYGDRREVTLSASCPEANRLLLASQERLTFLPREDQGGDELEREYIPFFVFRQQLLEALQNRERPLKEGLAALLALALDAQGYLDEGEDWALIDQVMPAFPEDTEEALFPGALEALEELEVLGEDWLPLLAAGKETEGLDIEANREALERICAYFLFRWTCKAVGDGDILGKVQLSLLGTLAAARLGAVVGLSEALRRFSREIEHSDENLEALQEAFAMDIRLTPERFFGELARERC